MENKQEINSKTSNQEMSVEEWEKQSLRSILMSLVRRIQDKRIRRLANLDSGGEMVIARLKADGTYNVFPFGKENTSLKGVTTLEDVLIEMFGSVEGLASGGKYRQHFLLREYLRIGRDWFRRNGVEEFKFEGVVDLSKAGEKSFWPFVLGHYEGKSTPYLYMKKYHRGKGVSEILGKNNLW